MSKEKEKKEKSCLLWGLNPRPSVPMKLTIVLAYLNTLQSGGNALGGSNLNVKFIKTSHSTSIVFNTTFKH
jgi:hypothetical protein